MRRQRTYDKEFRINAAKHYKSGEKSLAEVATRLGVPINLNNGFLDNHQHIL